jgi:multidrug resistance efflux pump
MLLVSAAVMAAVPFASADDAPAAAPPVPAAAPAPAASPAPAAAPAPAKVPATAEATRGELSIVIERAARVEPIASVPVRLELESFGGPVTVKDITRRSGPAKAGDMVAVLEGKDFERGLDDLRVQVEETRRRLAMQREERSMKARQVAAGLERAELAARLAAQSLELHRDYESAKSLEMADLGLKGQMDSLRDARDELAQLEKMYAGTSLQSETKDIVLDRARRGVERSETYSKYAKRDNEIFKAIRHPNEARRVEDAAKDAALALEAASLGQRLGEIRETLDMAQAERGLRDLERRLERMEGDGRRMTVKSPSDGYLVVKLRDVGAQLQPRQELAEVVDLGRLRVRGTLNADAMRFAKVGDVVDVWFPARPEVAAKAEIDEVVAVGAPEGEGASFAFTATLREPDASLLPGIEARVLVRANLADRLTVPSKALSQSKGRFTVKVMKDGATAEREVRVGASDGTRTEVIAGLEAGDAVVVTEG